MGFTPWVATIGNLTPPLTVANGGTGATTAAAALGDLGALVNQSTTALAGFSLLASGAPSTIQQWTTPNDGNLHQFWINALIDVTSAETGGAIAVVWTAPDGTASGTGNNLFAGGLAAGLHQNIFGGFAEANTTVTVQQQTNLTVGAAKAWVTIWGL